MTSSPTRRGWLYGGVALVAAGAGVGGAWWTQRRGAEGGGAKLDVCMQTRGWSRDRETGKTVGRHIVVPVVIEMRKVAGAWKFDRYYKGTGDCAGVQVREVRW